MASRVFVSISWASCIATGGPVQLFLTLKLKYRLNAGAYARGHGGFGSPNGWMIVHNIIVPINWEAILSAENSGKLLSGRGSAPNPAGGAHSAPPDRYGTESEPLTRDPTRPGCIWPDDPTRSLSVLWIERLFWRRCATNECMLSAKSLWSMQHTPRSRQFRA